MSLLREIKLILDFNSPSIRTLTLHQYDKNSTNIIVTCMDNGIICAIDNTSVNAYVKWAKSDGTYVLNDEVVNDDGTITIECTQQMLSACGRVNAELCLVDATTQEALHTMPFFVVIKKSVMNDEDISSTSEYQGLVNALIAVKEAEEFAEQFPEWEEKELQRQENELLREQNTATAIASCEEATENANTATQAANLATQNANDAADRADATNATAKELVTEMNEQLTSVTQAISDANTATNNAQSAADAANEIISDLNQLEADIENAENARVAAENIRVANEETRVSNENARIAAELLRQQNETARTEAEALRETNTATAIENANNAAETATAAAEKAGEITAVEVMTSDTLGIGKPDNNTITVSDGVLKAEIDKELLDKLGESEEGTLTFNGQEIRTSTDYIADTKAEAQAAIDAGLVEDNATIYVREDDGDEATANEADVMTGATEASDGESGLVPSPLSGQENYVLKGDGTWQPEVSIDVDDAISATSENPVQNKAVANELLKKADGIFYDEENSELQLKCGETVLATTTITSLSSTVPDNNDDNELIETASPTLSDNSPVTIQTIAQSGQAANIWSVGDSIPIELNGTVGSITLNDTYYAFIIGFDHNSSVEGSNSIHFQFGKNASGTDIAFVDAGCNSYYSSNASSRFVMNTTNTNSGGWASSYMRQTICVEFLAAMPTEWQNVIVACTKYSDNTGGGSDTDSYVTATQDKIWLLAEFEVFGTRRRANSAEQNYQKQYDYYANGNSRIKYKHSDTAEPRPWWLRSVYVGGTVLFLYVSSDSSNGYGSAYCSFGFAPGFKVV